MKDHEVKDYLRKTFDDGRLVRKERDALQELLGKRGVNDQKRALYRSMAFDIAREVSTAGDAEQRRMVMDWLEAVIKAFYPAEPIGVDANRVEAEVWFSPDDDCVGRIIDLLAQARQTVDICVFTITDNRIAEAIARAHQRGVRVRVISDDDKAFDKGSDVGRLRGQGIDCRVDNTEHHMHHKFAIFDHRLLLTGSYNWTRSAALNNEENFVISGDPRLLKNFARMFDKLWADFGRTS
ncbi:MAG: endonuclease [Verrucomicrobiales bacterium]|nr:endonuclease [Verrucomicrobiales bacterium]|tara:strand:+ start:18790 stop:19503 length:714 start_codon:yes stop_codon:yes gene_type:complete